MRRSLVVALGVLMGLTRAAEAAPPRHWVTEVSIRFFDAEQKPLIVSDRATTIVSVIPRVSSLDEDSRIYYWLEAVAPSGKKQALEGWRPAGQHEQFEIDLVEAGYYTVTVEAQMYQRNDYPERKPSAPDASDTERLWVNETITRLDIRRLQGIDTVTNPQGVEATAMTATGERLAKRDAEDVALGIPPGPRTEFEREAEEVKYRFVVRDPRGNLVGIRDWSLTNRIGFTPQALGSYEVLVFAMPHIHLMTWGPYRDSYSRGGRQGRPPLSLLPSATLALRVLDGVKPPPPAPQPKNLFEPASPPLTALRGHEFELPVQARTYSGAAPEVSLVWRVSSPSGALAGGSLPDPQRLAITATDPTFQLTADVAGLWQATLTATAPSNHRDQVTWTRTVQIHDAELHVAADMRPGYDKPVGAKVRISVPRYEGLDQDVLYRYVITEVKTSLFYEDEVEAFRTPWGVADQTMTLAKAGCRYSFTVEVKSRTTNRLLSLTGTPTGGLYRTKRSRGEL